MSLILLLIIFFIRVWILCLSHKGSTSIHITVKGFLALALFLLCFIVSIEASKKSMSQKKDDLLARTKYITSY